MKQITFEGVEKKDYLNAAEAVVYSKGEYTYEQLIRLFVLRVLPAFKRHREKPWYIARWIFDAHRAGHNVSKVDVSISKEDFAKILPTLRRGQ